MGQFFHQLLADANSLGNEMPRLVYMASLRCQSLSDDLPKTSCRAPPHFNEVGNMVENASRCFHDKGQAKVGSRRRARRNLPRIVAKRSVN
jgi:hypothetical protein